LDKKEKWHLKSKVAWLELQDQNTSCFHQYARHRQSVNIILDLQNEEGKTIKGFRDLIT